MVIDSDLSCIGVAANTVEYLEENIEDESEREYYQFCEQDWEIYNETNEYIDIANKQLKTFLDENNALISDNNSFYYTEFFEKFRESAFDTCIEALYEVKNSNFFNKLLNNGGFINFMIPEYLD